MTMLHLNFALALLNLGNAVALVIVGRKLYLLSKLLREQAERNRSTAEVLRATASRHGRIQ